MTKLSLGPIAKPELVKLTIALPDTLRDDLNLYAQLHAQTWGVPPMDAPTLIPHILAAFLARDRSFRRARRRVTADSAGRAE
jgi:hypothetical protein